MKISTADQLALVAEGNLAPSVHNTQPVRWLFEEDCISLFADPARFLKIGDPTLNDAGLSAGAALEGTIMALAGIGIGVQRLEDHWAKDTKSASGLKLAARIVLGDRAEACPLAQYAPQRFTWRGAFNPTAPKPLAAIASWAQSVEDTAVTIDADDMRWLAEANDRLSVRFFSSKPYREELRSWMRFSKSDPNWILDGLNAEAMQMSGFEAGAAKIALASPAFEMIKTLGLAKAMISERAKTISASGAAFFHRDAHESPIEAGRAFYRMWLELTRLGVVAWPMAVLADDPENNAACKQRFRIPEERRLINVLRFGAAPPDASVLKKARLDAADLILNEVE